MKKVLAFALVLVLVVALAAPACAISDKDDVYTLTFYHIFADEASGGHESLWINKAIAEVEEKSGGRLKIDCVPAGVMGSEEELIPQGASPAPRSGVRSAASTPSAGPNFPMLSTTIRR